MTYAQLTILLSLLCMILGLFTPLPAGIFGTAGVIGTLLGWGYEMRQNKKAKNDDGVIDVDFTVEDNKKVSFDQRLRKLEDLLKDGLITDEEYERKRKEIMKSKW